MSEVLKLYETSVFLKLMSEKLDYATIYGGFSNPLFYNRYQALILPNVNRKTENCRFTVLHFSE